ncbi:MAG: glycosyltransferase [Actinobacteria bacterium]|nr:MAG: glycosyltransferase [Actinomycetota bacterium]
MTGDRDARGAPLVTAMMLVRDRADLMPEAIESVLAQTEPDFELLIIDDNSADDSLAVAQAFADRDPRVRVFANGRPLGIPRSRNRALGLARGRFLAICDSDDISEPDRFSRHSAMLIAEPDLGGVGGAIRCFTGDPVGGEVPTWHWGLRDGRPEFAFPAAMFRVKALRRVGGFDPGFRVAEDLDLAYRLVGAGYELRRDDAVAVNYRLHPGNVTASHARSRQLATLRAQLRGLRLMNGQWSVRGYAVIGQSVLRLARPPR